jgi:hypothetical protein
MLQAFHTDVAKVEWDVAFVAMVCTHNLQAFVPNVASVFILMLHMFHTYVANILSGRCVCFAMG